MKLSPQFSGYELVGFSDDRKPCLRVDSETQADIIQQTLEADKTALPGLDYVYPVVAIRSSLNAMWEYYVPLEFNQPLCKESCQTILGKLKRQFVFGNPAYRLINNSFHKFGKWFQ